MDCRALFFEGPRRVAIRAVALAAPARGQVLARGLASSISQGTELLLYRGEGPEPFDPSLRREGGGEGSTYPCRYGYAWVGSVVERGPDVTVDVGARVFALVSHADAHALAATEVRPIRADVPAARASLAANLETAVGCVWDAEVAFGERVVVLGAGLVGALVAWLLSRQGAKVTLVDPKATRRRCAAKLAPGIALLAARPSDGTAEATADVVIEASGNPAVLDDAIAWAAPSARIVVASFYGRRRAPIDLGDAFHRRRLSLVSSQVSTIPPRLAPRWSYDRRFDLVQDLLGEPNLDALLAPSVAFDDAPALYAQLDQDPDPMPCHVFDYGR